MITLIKILAALAILIILIGAILTVHTQLSPHQKEFLSGIASSTIPDGFYQGSADFPTLSWQGKLFDASHMTGQNQFVTSVKIIAKKYPFTLDMRSGIRDAGARVISLDYNRPENPFWLRPVLDEMTEQADGSYVGKVHYRLIPYFPFALGYFKMRK